MAVVVVEEDHLEVQEAISPQVEDPCSPWVARVTPGEALAG